MQPKMESLLIVEDEEDVRETVVDLFQAAPFATLTANNGAAGLECILKMQPTAVLTDISMPELTGIDMIQKVRAAGLDTPIVIMTGYNNAANNAQAIRFGAFEVVAKPFDLSHLEQVIFDAIKFGANLREFESYWQNYLQEHNEIAHFNEDLIKAKRQMMKMKFLNRAKAA